MGEKFHEIFDEKSFLDRVVSKIFSQIPINTDWSQLTDRWVFPEESLVSTKIFLCCGLTRNGTILLKTMNQLFPFI